MGTRGPGSVRGLLGDTQPGGGPAYGRRVSCSWSQSWVPGSQLGTNVDTPASFWCPARLQGDNSGHMGEGRVDFQVGRGTDTFPARAAVPVCVHPHPHPHPHVLTSLHVQPLPGLEVAVWSNNTISLARAPELQPTSPRPGHCQPSPGLRGLLKSSPLQTRARPGVGTGPRWRAGRGLQGQPSALQHKSVEHSRATRRGARRSSGRPSWGRRRWGSARRWAAGGWRVWEGPRGSAQREKDEPPSEALHQNEKHRRESRRTFCQNIIEQQQQQQNPP